MQAKHVVWGAINGFYLIFSLQTQKFRNKLLKYSGLSERPVLKKYWKVIITFSLTCIAWIFFRAANITDALYIVTHLFTDLGNIFNINYILSTIGNLGLTYYEFAVAILSILCMETVHLIQRHNKMRNMLSEKPVLYKWSVYYAIILCIILYGVFGQNQFIYFQF